MSTCRRTAVILVQVVVGAGALAGQPTRGQAAAERERVCQAAELPKILPPIDAVLDTAAFRSLIGGVAARPESTPYVASVLFGARGEVAAVRLLGPAENDPAITEAFRASVRPQRHPGPWGVRLRVTPGPPLAVEVDRSVYCPPAPATESDRPGAGDGTLRVGTEGRLARPSERRRLEATVMLSEAGRVVDVKLTRRSGMTQFDDFFVSALQAAQYLPALFDGFPIPSWYRTNDTWLRL